jgi:uncharacterized membrane protein YGL010W
MPHAPIEGDSMRNATELMVQYAGYHRDRRNIATHFVGIPLIVFAIGVLLGRPSFEVAGLQLSPAWIVWALATAWYLTRGNLALAQPLAAGSTSGWLTWGIGAFAVGWVFQFVGHYYEGRKPAFVDDLVGLLVGPMFVAGELLFMLGWGQDMQDEIERRAGPTHLRDLARPLARH